VTVLAQLCASLYDSRIGTGIRESDNLYSIIETVHVLAITLVVGTISLVDLRLLGLVLKQAPVSEVLGSLVRVTWAGFALMLATGLLLFWAQATQLSRNPMFQLKLLLLALAGLNALFFHRCMRRTVWDGTTRAPRAAQISALISLAVWSAVVALGRAIAYF
jgi:hypothetical protein